MNPAIEHLTRAIPPTDAPRAHDWTRVEEELGTILPSDYKQLVDLYGGGLFDDAIWVLEPDCPNEHYDLAVGNHIRVEAQRGLWKGGEPKPAGLDEAGSRTIDLGRDRER
ncbi:SMI1/KNR4 family protein [Streptomyces spororaveus]|uniref:SMI1/KNR4 family protein n=1 Tax=Streptomyces spororaveus TaxID=284039 RepID=UPI0037A8DA18